MSGDCRNQPVIFYSEEMTDAKIMLLQHQGIKFKIPKYYKIEEDVESEY